MTPPEQHSVAVELERLRGAVDTGFAKLDGRLDASLQRTGQIEKDVGDLEGRVTALERARWPLPSLAAVVSVAALGLTVYQSTSR